MSLKDLQAGDKPRLTLFTATERLDVVSPRYRQPDRAKKVAIYERAGVAEYILVDSWLRGEAVDYEVLGYRLQADIYSQIQPNEQGWIFSEVNNVWIGVSEARDRFFVMDGRTGERILPDREARTLAETRAEAEAMARQQAEARAAALESRLRELEARCQTQADEGQP